MYFEIDIEVSVLYFLKSIVGMLPAKTKQKKKHLHRLIAPPFFIAVNFGIANNLFQSCRISPPPCLIPGPIHAACKSNVCIKKTSRRNKYIKSVA